MSELKPCPFCGGSKLSNRITLGLRKKCCDTCGAEGPPVPVEVDRDEKLIDTKLNAAWNKRHE
jgi:hypothetical protein